MTRTNIRKLVVTVLGLLPLAVLLVVLYGGSKPLNVQLLYATRGETYDAAAYGQLKQSLLAGLQVDKRDLSTLRDGQLDDYDTIYLDPSLHQSMSDQERKLLMRYVRRGGHLFLENRFAGDFDPSFLGAAQVLDVPAPTQASLPTAPGKTLWTYPGVDADTIGVQQLVRTFADTFFRHDTEASLSRFDWGKGLVPSTARTIASMNGIALYAVNDYGEGTVFFSGTLLPSRYYITGYDLMSGMDGTLGFDKLAAEKNASIRPTAGALYFDRKQIPIEPYFHFTFSAGNALLRTEYVSFVSKKKYGFSVRKVLGPYGRPAMAHQNHFEAMEAIRDGEGIQWTDLLREHRQIPSYSLVRAAFPWGRWQESVVVHLNTGTNAKPEFAGETPNSFYSSGTRLLSDGRPIRLAPYPAYRSLGDPITEPMRAAPTVAELDGDGVVDVAVGSSDGRLYLYPGRTAPEPGYAAQQLPEGLAAPQRLGEPRVLTDTRGAPLAIGPYAGVAAYDVNADGPADLVFGRADGTLGAALRTAGGYAVPAALLGGGEPIRGAAPLAPAIADVTMDAVPDLVVGDAGGAVTLYEGARGPDGALVFGGGRELVRLPSPYAAPSVRDMNGDGRPDLVVGGLEGDLRVYTQQVEPGGGVTWRDAGVLEGATVNQLGSRALVGGHNAVPVWRDMNGDGRDDLIVGQLEFSEPWPIDASDFPYREQLVAFLEHSQKHRLELYPHLFMHQYTSDEQEKQEIALHKQAFEQLGVPWQLTGTNQHTWRINNPNRTQTLDNERAAGIWFNFGFKPSYIKADPRLGVEYNWGLPFLLTGADGEPSLERPMLLYTPAPVLRTDPATSTKDLFEAYAASDMPIDYFEHIEYHFPLRVPELLPFVHYLNELRDRHSYNFMTETQMARSFLNTLTTDVSLSRPWHDAVTLRLKRMLGLPAEPRFIAVPDTSRVPTEAAEYKGTLGVAVELGAAYAGRTPAVLDADVHDVRADKLYVGVTAPTEIRFARAEADPSASGARLQLLRVNVPYALETRAAAQEWRLQLEAPGMQQVVLRAPAAPPAAHSAAPAQARAAAEPMPASSPPEDAAHSAALAQARAAAEPTLASSPPEDAAHSAALAQARAAAEPTLASSPPEDAAHSAALAQARAAAEPTLASSPPEDAAHSANPAAPAASAVQPHPPARLIIEGPELDIVHDAEAGTYTVTHFGDPVELIIRVAE
ncbi:VCBS repeat-containing protein [Paenibacillus sp. YYML68]|uniref:FG-GAP repeat domain-containing protein n=1 Tax=Paenibacillus sp. YYML68 TaxID=2909250 RepID=UPI00249366EA|nr:VCBS repeat-containing protein [Paenibacillus sp. YYML68]